MPKVSSTCERCGNRIEHFPSQHPRWCSKACRAADGGMPRKPRTGSDRDCPICGKSFWVEKGQAATRKFCSRECQSKSQVRRFTLQCAQCSKSFDVPESKANTKFCSRECMGAANYRRALGRMHKNKPALVDKQGYVRIFEPDHPRAMGGGWVFEHRWMVEQSLGRFLARDENVHHVNHIRHDNRIENLEVLGHSAHSKVTGRENGEALRVALEARQKLQEYEKRFGPL